MNFDRTFLIGLLATIGVFVLVFFAAGAGVDIESMLIVVGGTLAAGLLATPSEALSLLKDVPHLMSSTPLARRVSIVQAIFMLSEKMRLTGVLSLQQDLSQLDDPLLRKGVSLVIDGVDASTVRWMLESERISGQEKREALVECFIRLGNLAPAMGLIGTVMGLASMLRTLNDPSTLGPGMALALQTTLYGAMLSNLIFIPIGGRLKERFREEAISDVAIVEGVSALGKQLSPMHLEELLSGFMK
jgi:chemotaxis protein MotA